MINQEKSITYKALWYLFVKDKKVCGYNDSKQLVGASVVTTAYSTGMFPCFNLNCSVIKANGKTFYTTSHKFRILPYPGMKKIADLPVRLLDDGSDELKRLTERGEKFSKLATGVHYQNYEGYIYQKEGWWGYQMYKATGRVITDGISFNRINPNSRTSQGSLYSQDRYNEQTNSFPDVPVNKRFMTWPSVSGFSFSAKKWGEILVEGLKPLKFDDTAFDRLVLPPKKKQLIRALVENSDNTFGDIITGKGGGCIFLLHGSPGVGKTLTAESMAELLHRPLYSVSVGELGTTPDTLEKKLVEILEVSSSWNAVILLDEADIFLEKRTENDITRNAMVGIFLRLLEYHQGVLFLTTNRVKCFDKAFHSRISVALQYEDLDQAARKQVWHNMFDAAGVDFSELDLDALAKYDLNGRQIRTLTRLALSLAKTESEKVQMSHLKRTIELAMLFDIHTNDEQTK
eukprot:TRINITY_DN12044_c0_g1_i1.p1 TRINITY_DN12044_c0_g1~~TRINITY_DN12044_c0_g1_i1.p1  ORF type:complete len:459 (-),score=85.44 TRINITY_DN12044_c0_g1_i1:33-1409(-)